MDPQQLNGVRTAKTILSGVRREFPAARSGLIDQYNPDLLYLTITAIGTLTEERLRQSPECMAGMPELTPHIMAYYYNAISAGTRANWTRCSISRTCQPRCEYIGARLRDEPGAAIEPDPWQTDTCIGGWHYSRAISKPPVQDAQSMIHLLVDVVSRTATCC